jgi:hypothetical protein
MSVDRSGVKSRRGVEAARLLESAAERDAEEGRCVSIPAAGGYDKLVLVPAPRGGTRGPNTAREGEDALVHVSTTAAGVNYADVCVRWGLYESAKR